MMGKRAAILPVTVAILLAVGPALADPEECNGLDDDDDGLTDEDVVDCSDGEVCYFAQCLADCSGDAGVCDEEHACYDGACHYLCDESELFCPSGWMCDTVDDGWLCIPDVCNPSLSYGLPCAQNPYCCDEGFTPPCHCEAVPRLCVDDCYGKTCPDGWVCVPRAGGQCLSPDLGCYVAGCDEGQVCVAGQCVADPCFGVTCDVDEVCNASGECVVPCLTDQCEDQGCFEGECVDDPCAGVQCPPGMSCEDGECIVGECWNVPCEYWEICENGDCVEDPCWNVDCPDCMLCIGGGCYEYSPGSDADADTDADADADADADTDSGTGEPAVEDPVSTMGAIDTRCGCSLIGISDFHIIVGIFGPLF